jgi:ABC-type lipoprotein export system ATPase subunit
MMVQTQAAVSLQGVKKSFPLGYDGQLEVLHIAQWTLPAGSTTVLKGLSGSGKTTLLNLIAGISVPSAGKVWVQNTDIFALPEPQRDRFRAQHIGYIFQTFNLLAPFTALENVWLSMRFSPAIAKGEQRQRAQALLSQLGLSSRLGHKPHQLSRGEQQRVAMARALANNPPLLLADEPCASLDGRTAQAVLESLLAICHQARKTLLMVSHDALVIDAADRALDISEINHVMDTEPI